MVLYVDTSALLKRYVAEAESENVIAKMDAATATSTALITRTEVAAALSRARRENRMDADEARRVEQAFLEDWADVRKVPVTEELVGSAAQLSWTRELRAYDAVQFAAGLRCQAILARLREDTVFACFDKKLRRAARAEGLETWPVDRPDGGTNLEQRRSRNGRREHRPRWRPPGAWQPPRRRSLGRKDRQPGRWIVSEMIAQRCSR